MSPRRDKPRGDAAGHSAATTQGDPAGHSAASTQGDAAARDDSATQSNSPTPIAAPTLAELLADKRLIVMVGEGGVGKTSTSAAVALGRARSGRHVAVLTVDPAPRLGDALGISAIDAKPRRVALGSDALGTLVAMRLDSKGTFDRMVERYAPSPAAAAALLAHPVYQAVSGQLGGTEHYMAFQRLHELVEEHTSDVLVIDTPPAVNAVELLAAPARLTGLLDTGALSILAEPARIVARAGGAIARASLSLLLAAVERVTGDSLQKGVSEFTTLFGDLVGGLEDRAREIDALLRAPETAFVLVVRPRSADVTRALAFRDSLARMGIPLAAVIVNRVTPPPPSDRMKPRSERLADLPPSLRGAVTRMEKDMDALRNLENRALDALRSRLQGDHSPPLFTLHARDVDIASVADIASLADDLGV